MKIWEINILNQTYDISLQKFGDDAVADENTYGITIFTNSNIFINEILNATQQRETLLHEILHIISTHTGLAMSERQITGLSSVLYDTMKNNINCFKQILE